MSRRIVSLLVIATFAAACLAPAAMAGPGDTGAQRLTDGQALERLAGLALPSPLAVAGSDPHLDRARGDSLAARHRVMIRLSAPSVSERAANADAAATARTIKVQQAAMIDRLRRIDTSAKVLAATQVALNAVFVKATGETLEQLAGDPAVESIVPLGDYQLMLPDTVPHVGASAVHDLGLDGSGVRVAVIDTGIDYHHAALGGSGDPADYAGNDPTVIEPGTFPTAKVIGGYDFVGSQWTGGAGAPAEAPDPDPLDDSGPAAGHGTHVADILAGAQGVAPGASLYGLKVCSSITPFTCSGMAVIQAIDFALDPDNDGDPSDAVDIINLSLGHGFGQPLDDAVILAVENASALGALTVASAGNGGHLPFYIVASPSVAPSALSVAQTQAPYAALQTIDVDGQAYLAVEQTWAPPLTGAISAPVQYADGAGGNLLGCEEFAPGSLGGRIVLVDRGVCNFTLKARNVSLAGGLATIIGLNAPGPPISGGDGGDRPIIAPAYIISQVDAGAIKAAIASGGGAGVLDPGRQASLVGQMFSGSSRGPSQQLNAIKPEIGAPGVSRSARVGTGVETEPFAGTSGAAPMVAGAAALLLQAEPGLAPHEVKARLMNTATTEILDDPFSGRLAPISRIGGGELRVDRAVSTPAAAWDDATGAGALSFGLVPMARPSHTVRKDVRVRNYSATPRVYQVTPTFRFAEDAADPAVTVTAPSQVSVPAGSDAVVRVTVTIRGDLLPGNHMSSGPDAIDPAALDTNEYDGYIVLDDGSAPIHLPWHVLPRKEASVSAPDELAFQGMAHTEAVLDNKGVGTGQVDAFAFLARSGKRPPGPPAGLRPVPDLHAVGVSTTEVPAGFCSPNPSFVWAFAFSLHRPLSNLATLQHEVWLDTDRDGTDDFRVRNFDFAAGAGFDGRQATIVTNLSTGGLSALFFAEHATNTRNTVLRVCAEQVGLGATDLGTTRVDADFFARDFYGYYEFMEDAMTNLSIVPGGERYRAGSVDVGPQSTAKMTVSDHGQVAGATAELGLLLFTNADRGPGARGAATRETEMLMLRVRP